jgi:hypothetical protein
MDTQIHQSDRLAGADMANVPHRTGIGSAMRPRKFRRKFVVLAAALVLIVLIGMGWSWWLFGRNAVPFNENTNIHKSEFQAVFLTNGQVYFGKLNNLNDKYITLTDIYYLQVQQNQGLQGSSSSTSSSSQVSLAKLGNELHGPEDEMYIASGQVLFWENLKDTGKVVEAIDKYQAQQ